MKTDVPKATIDLIIIFFISFFSFLIFSKFDVLEKNVELSAAYEDYEIDEILSTLIVLSFCLIWFSFRRWRESKIINKELLGACPRIGTWVKIEKFSRNKHSHIIDIASIIF